MDDSQDEVKVEVETGEMIRAESGRKKSVTCTSTPNDEGASQNTRELQRSKSFQVGDIG